MPESELDRILRQRREAADERDRQSQIAAEEESRQAAKAEERRAPIRQRRFTEFVENMRLNGIAPLPVFHPCGGQATRSWQKGCRWRGAHAWHITEKVGDGWLLRYMPLPDPPKIILTDGRFYDDGMVVAKWMVKDPPQGFGYSSPPRWVRSKMPFIKLENRAVRDDFDLADDRNFHAFAAAVESLLRRE